MVLACHSADGGGMMMFKSVCVCLIAPTSCEQGTQHVPFNYQQLLAHETHVQSSLFCVLSLSPSAPLCYLARYLVLPTVRNFLPTCMVSNNGGVLNCIFKIILSTTLVLNCFYQPHLYHNSQAVNFDDMPPTMLWVQEDAAYFDRCCSCYAPGALEHMGLLMRAVYF